jgi:hypothetical protein
LKREERAMPSCFAARSLWLPQRRALRVLGRAVELFLEEDVAGVQPGALAHQQGINDVQLGAGYLVAKGKGSN